MKLLVEEDGGENNEEKKNNLLMKNNIDADDKKKLEKKEIVELEIINILDESEKYLDMVINKKNNSEELCEYEFYLTYFDIHHAISLCDKIQDDDEKKDDYMNKLKSLLSSWKFLCNIYEIKKPDEFSISDELDDDNFGGEKGFGGDSDDDKNYMIR